MSPSLPSKGPNSLPGKVPIPPVQPTDADPAAWKVLISAAVVFALFVLILSFLLVSAPTPDRTDLPEDRTGTGMTPSGEQTGNGSSDENDSSQGRTPPASENPGDGQRKKHFAQENPQNHAESRADGKERTSLPMTEDPPPEEPSLGERIAANLSRPQPPAEEEGAGNEGGSGGVTVRIFGLGGYGSKFMYVFDRSWSMGGSKLKDAKDELLKSLSVLDERHRFNLIFYDTVVTVWKPERKLIPAGIREKKDAEEFIQGIASRGGTSHRPALLEAIEHKPDVIFFLTDGQSLTEEELDDITRKSGEIAIHVIQFADASEARSVILRQLASKNRGRYKYINVALSDAL